MKLKHLPEWIEKRREIASLYHGGLSDLLELKLPPPPHSNDRFFDVYQNYVIQAKERDKLVAHLMESGIEILVSWSKPTHHHDALGLKHFHLPKTEQISNGVLSLPMYPELNDKQVEFVVEDVRNFYKYSYRNKG